MAEAVKIPIKELNRYIMFAPCPGSPAKKSRLAWAIRDGNPRITVYTNDPNDTTGYGIISAPMNPETFFNFLRVFSEVVDAPNNTKTKVDCYTAYRNDDGSIPEKTLLSELWFGKDSDGIVWMSVVAANRPKIKFEFRVSDYHKIYTLEGVQMTETMASQLQAKSVIHVMNEVYPALTSEFRQPTGNAPRAAPKPPELGSPASIDFDLDVAF